MQQSHDSKQERVDVLEFVSAKVNGSKKPKFSGSRTPFPPMDAEWNEEMANALAPPGGRIRMDTFNGRWKGVIRIAPAPWLTVSRSWGKYGGHRECIKLVLQEMWKYASALGVPCTVAGLGH